MDFVNHDQLEQIKNDMEQHYNKKYDEENYKDELFEDYQFHNFAERLDHKLRKIAYISYRYTKLYPNISEPKKLFAIYKRDKEREDELNKRNLHLDHRQYLKEKLRLKRGMKNKIV